MNMKKIYKYIAISFIATLSVVNSSCSDDQSYANGYGNATFDIEVNSQVERTRGALTEDALSESCVLYVYTGNKLVRKYRGLSGLKNAESLVLLGGEYRAEATAGKSVPASFNDQYYKGETTFTVSGGTTQQVQVPCKIQNIVVSVSATDEILGMLQDLNITVSNSAGALEFVADSVNVAKGYFMMPDGDVNLNYTLSAKSANGTGEITKQGVIESVKPAHEYVLTIKYNQDPSLIGGVYFDLEVEEVKPTTEVITITAAPKFSGAEGLDLTNTVTTKPGELKAMSINIMTCSPLTSLVLECSSVSMLSSGVDYVKATSDFQNQLKDALDVELQDLTATELPDREENDNSEIRVLKLGEKFARAIDAQEGTYVLNITATDTPIDGAAAKSTSVSLTIEVSNAKVVAEVPASGAVTYREALLTATINDETSTGYAFEYREADAATRAAGEWIQVTDVTVEGTKYSAKVTGLRAGVKYEYRAICNEFVGDIVPFYTLAYPQIENAGFETWGESGKIVLPAAGVDSRFWDCGNHGSSTMNVNVTNSDTEKKHSGSYSAKLRSQFVGLGKVGKFAAGNIFVGQYLATKGTNGVIGFGRPFDFPVENGKIIKPKAVKVWVRYEPGTVEKNGAKEGYLAEGATDQGQIYIALCGESADNDDVYDGVGYARVVNTATSRFFEANAANVIAYGEKTFTEKTAGDGLVELTINFEDVNATVAPKYIVIVASASKYGDFFCGGEGSTMWLDDVELVYE